MAWTEISETPEEEIRDGHDECAAEKLDTIIGLLREIHACMQKCCDAKPEEEETKIIAYHERC